MLFKLPIIQIRNTQRVLAVLFALLFLGNFLLAPAVCKLWESTESFVAQDVLLMETLNGEIVQIPFADCDTSEGSHEHKQTLDSDCSFCVLHSSFSMGTAMAQPLKSPISPLKNAYGYETPFRLSPELGSLSSRAPPLYV